MTLTCPACRKVKMRPQTDPGTQLEIDFCPECHGLWFDAQELSKFFESKTLKKKFFLEDNVKSQESVGYTISVSPRACPRCHIVLKEKHFGDVVLDICPECYGIFLDDGELVRIVKSYELGRGGEKIVKEELAAGLSGKGPSASSIKGVFSAILSFLGTRVR
ncbi:MAG: zf-TFIIB domain-containing protein [Vulcanimicrobiota bacterium]